MKTFSKFVDIKEQHDYCYLPYIVEAFDRQINQAKDIAGLEGWTPAHKKELKLVYNFLLKTFPNVTPQKLANGHGPIAAGSGGDAKKGKFKINSAYNNVKIGKKTFDHKYIKDVLLKDKTIKFAEFGNGSTTKGGSTIFADFGVSNATTFIEFFQAFGFFVSTDIDEGNFKSVLKSTDINGDFPLLVKDWKKFIDALHQDKVLRHNVIELVNGSYHFKVKESIKKPYVVVEKIKQYYSALLAFEKDIDFVKDNTSDIVVIEAADLSTIETALQIKGQTIGINEKTGKLSTTKKTKVSWYQVSLKEAENGARLGRVTTQFKAMYLPDDDASNLDIALNREEQEQYNISLNEFVELYNEGWFDKVKSFASKVVDVIKSKVEALKNLVTGWFGFFFKKQKLNNWKTETNSVLSDVQKIIDSAKKNESPEEFENRTGKNYIDRVAKYKRTLGEERDFLFEKVTVQDEISALFKNKKAMKSFRELVQERLSKIEKNKNRAVYKSITKIGGVGTIKAKIARDTIRHNLGNSISFEIINTMISKFPSKNIMQYVSDIKDEMVMGSTNYPVVKLYGDATKANTEVLTRTKTKQQVDIKAQYPLIVSCDGSGGQYYVINVYMISKVDADPEKSQYNLLQFTNAGAQFAYKIEGNKTESYSFLIKKFGL
jgi:uncharacterized protein YlzI (FlbEa/FlbD family)